MKRLLFLFLTLMVLWNTSCIADAPKDYFNYEYNYDLDGIIITEISGQIV